MMTKAKSAPEEASTTKTCFVMMPISDVDDYPVGHFGEVYKQLIEPAVIAAGYQCTLATSTSAAHMIQLEVVTKVATADLCICDLSTNNPNVLFEYGIRQAFDKPTVLIKDDKTRRIFDLSGFRDIEYDHTLRIAKTLEARAKITKAIEDTVNGSGDEEQVFSLVQLMKLTKAALPAGEVNKDDARFELLERKLDHILAQQASMRISIPPSVRLSDEETVSRGARWSFMYGDDYVTIRDTFANREKTFKDLNTMQRSDIFKAMPPDVRAKISKEAERFLLPF